MSAPAVALHRIVIKHGAHAIVHDVSLELAPAELHVLLGASGSGKTTLLRAVAGFHPIARGRLELFGALADDGVRCMPPEQRRVGVVFQDFALFAHLRVSANVAFGRPDKQASDFVPELLERVGLAGYGERHVSDLSGGEQQRVALARTLAQEPRIVLFDEPFSSLNRELRRSLRAQTLAILRERKIAALFVTHEPEEAFALADRMSVLHEGRLLQTDTPAVLYEKPRSLVVGRSVGDAVVVRATADGERAVQCALGRIAVHEAGPSTAHVLLRPEQLRVQPGGAMRITARRYLGAFEELDLVLPSGEPITARSLARAVSATESTVGLEVTGTAAALDGV